jgi:hypothetical protein
LTHFFSHITSTTIQSLKKWYANLKWCAFLRTPKKTEEFLDMLFGWSPSPKLLLGRRDVILSARYQKKVFKSLDGEHEWAFRKVVRETSLSSFHVRYNGFLLWIYKSFSCFPPLSSSTSPSPLNPKSETIYHSWTTASAGRLKNNPDNRPMWRAVFPKNNVKAFRVLGKRPW